MQAEFGAVSLDIIWNWLKFPDSTTFMARRTVFLGLILAGHL